MGYEYPVDKTKNKLEHLLKSDKDKIFVATVQSIVVGYIHANDYDVIYAPHMKNVWVSPFQVNIKSMVLERLC